MSSAPRPSVRLSVPLPSLSTPQPLKTAPGKLKSPSGSKPHRKQFKSSPGVHYTVLKYDPKETTVSIHLPPGIFKTLSPLPDRLQPYDPTETPGAEEWLPPAPCDLPHGDRHPRRQKRNTNLLVKN